MRDPSFVSRLARVSDHHVEGDQRRCQPDDGTMTRKEILGVRVILVILLIAVLDMVFKPGL
jgi:hypothetical protein